MRKLTKVSSVSLDVIPVISPAHGVGSTFFVDAGPVVSTSEGGQTTGDYTPKIRGP